jgi:tetratricopeptide (TPR) repeat protein
MLKMKYFFLLVFIFSFSLSYSQNTDKIDSLVTLLKTAKEDTNKVNYLNDLSWQYNNIGDCDTALYYGNSALQLAQRLIFKKGVANSFSNIGIIYGTQGNYPKALDYLFRSLKTMEEYGNKSGIANSFSNIGIIYGTQGNYPKALDYLFKSLKIMEECGNKNGIATCFSGIGIIYGTQENYPKALDYFLKSLRMAEQIKQTKLQSDLLGNIGNIYVEQKHFPEALDYYLKELRLDTKLENNGGVASDLGNIGNVYFEQKDFPKASDYFLKALEMDEELGDRAAIAIDLSRIGSLYTSIKEYKRAENYFLRSLALSDSIGDSYGIMDVNKNISELYETMGETDKALQHYKKAMIIKDTLFNQEKNKDITRKEMNYEFEKKEALTKAEHEKQIAIADAELRQATTERNAWIGGALGLIIIGSLLAFYLRTKRRSEKIRLEKQLIELEQKALSLQMNPHFIFNSLNSISSFISKNDPVSAKKYLSKFASLMRLILENSREPFIPLQKEIETLTYYLELEQLRFENKFEFKIEIAPGIEINSVIIPPMLIQPQIENAIIHGVLPKEERGSILICFYLKDNNIICEVTDNGIGRKRSMELNYQNENLHKSLALQVTEERLDAINAQADTDLAGISIIDMTDEQHNSLGTKVVLNLPLQTN